MRSIGLGFVMAGWQLAMAACANASSPAQAEGGAPVVAAAGTQTKEPAMPRGSQARSIHLQRYLDRTEAAFVILAPRGWLTEGGMVRVNPMTAGGAGQSVEAKIDFTLKRDAAGKVMIRYLPHVNYVVPSPYVMTPQWNGMPVAVMPTPAAFLTQGFTRLRPRAQAFKVLKTEPRPDIVQAVQQGPKARSLLSAGAGYYADAAALTVVYEEDGTRFKEVLFTAIEGFSMMGVGMWSNALTIVARAPEVEFDTWGPVAKVVVNSFQLNPAWVAAELRGQAQRTKIVGDTLAHLQQIDKEIAESRSRTQAAIQSEAYLTLTGQEEYLNPFTGRPELGSNEWKHRWESSFGEVIYADDGAWDPNLDPALHVQGFQRSKVRPR
ncbi:MAG: hypothetical protein HY901_15770 [Deltaproteobacteria bacterium]|nr:hypothetical protein [Deltaproteobacteria bacterium]